MTLFARRREAAARFKYRCVLLVPTDHDWGPLPSEPGRTVYFPDWRGSYDISGLVQTPRLLVTQPDQGAVWSPETVTRIQPFQALRAKAEADPELRGILDGIRTRKELVLRLLEAYFFEGELPDYVWTSDEAPLAALSGFVFEAVDVLSPTEITWSSVTETTTFDLKVRKPGLATPASTFRTLPEQQASGIYFRVDGGDPDRDPRARIEALHEARIRLRRSVGPVPDPIMPVIAEVLPSRRVQFVPSDPALETTARERNYDAIDTLSPRELVGKTIHYRLEYLDAFNQVLWTSALSLVRDRLDEPAPASEAVARLVVTEDAAGARRTDLELSAVWETFEEEDLSLLEVQLYAERRPLDACGFYGDDDDQALLEILREADIAVDPLVTEAIEPATERVRGRNERRGLRLLDTWPLLDGLSTGELVAVRSGPVRAPTPDDRRTQTVHRHRWTAFEIPFGEGYRLHLGIQRRSRTGGPPTVSVLTACRHQVQYAPPGVAARGAVSVFQLENISWDRPSTSPFVPASSLLLQTRATGSRAVLLSFFHPRPEAPDRDPLVGGYRVFVRDKLGDHDGSPFFLADEVQVVPPMISEYRQVAFSAGSRYRIADLPSAQGRINAAAPAGQERALLRAAQKLLSELPWIRVRGDVLSRLPKDGEAPASEPETSKEAPKGPAYLTVSLLDEPESTSGEAADAESTDEQKEKALIARLAHDWRLIGRLTGLLESQGLVVDFVVRSTGDVEADWQAALDKVVAAPGFDSIKLLLLQTSDVEPRWMRTFRAIVVPSAAWRTEHLPPAGVLRRAYETFFDSARMKVLTDRTTDPVVLTLGDGNRVDYAWDRLADQWHHDLEWAVQMLDRYHRIRTLLIPSQEPPRSGRPSLAAIDRAFVAPLTILRSEPVSDRAAVLPVSTRKQATIAFRVLETNERGAAAGNALAAVRSGEIRLNLRTEQRFADAALYAAALDALPLDTWASKLESARDTYGLPGDDLLSLFPVRPGEELIEPYPGTDLIEMKHLPYYLEHHLTAWITADAQAGPPSSASQTRLPLRLGLEHRPKAAILAEHLVVSMIPPLLGSHLTPAERAYLDQEPELLLGAFVSDATMDLLPLRQAVDLRVGLTLYLNEGSAAEVKAVPFAWVGVPDAWLRGPEALGPARTSFGFTVEPRASWVAPSTVDWNGSNHVLDIAIKYANGAMPEALRVVQGERGKSHALYLTLHRGKLVSPLIELHT